jgi:hypothetical protein
VADSRGARIDAALRRVLGPDERVVARGRCWAALRRERVPLLFLGRHQYDVVLTQRRAMLFSRAQRRLRADDVALAKRFDSLTLEAQRQRFPLLQHRVRTNSGTRLVLEWRPRYRAVGRVFAEAITGPRAATGPVGPAAAPAGR